MHDPQRLLFISDQHLPIGPPEAIRPEMRRMSRRIGGAMEDLLNRFELRLRREANLVERIACAWLSRHERNYDLIVNGGDNALPMSRHEDRLRAAREIWGEQLARFGEDRYLALTGNHELGHGYEIEPGCYPDLIALREELFSHPINRQGYGCERRAGCILAVVDSELIAAARLAPDRPFIMDHLARMRHDLATAFRGPGPVLLLTHNTGRTRRWLRHQGLWRALIAGGRQVVILGGHFHVPRAIWRDGAEIHWSGGASYPEPWMRFLVRVPFTGIMSGGPGAIEVGMTPQRLFVRHRSFGVPMRHIAAAA